ncbi:MAG: PQQ-binding-like beta-propeller repeat protein [Gammaproteobacteria bacterium]|nr:PQQ-binding-like beta-propeller repeat protein [Gammaproteobacteria bacterium]
MNSPATFIATLTALFFFTSCASQEVLPPTPEPIWSQTLERPLQFHSLVDSHVLIAGTGRHLYAFDPQTGTQRWRERNVNPARQDIYRVNDSSMLLVTDAGGGAFDDADTHLLAINADDGLLMWESPRLEGKVMQGVLTEDGGTVYVTAVGEAHGDDRGLLSTPISGKGFGSGVFREPHLLSLDLKSGEIVWRATFGRKVRMQPAPGAVTGSERPFDLGNYHRPQIFDRLLCVTYLGIKCMNRFTGETVWERKFPVVEDELALSYAQSVVTGAVLYATGDNHVYALDLQTGDRLWRSAKANVLPELLVDSEIVFSQLGGRFFHLGKERWIWKGEFGVMAVHRDTGKTRWRFDKAKGAITNLHLEGDQLWFADENRLYSLDKRTGERLVRKKHQMKEAPAFTVINKHGQLVLISDDEVTAFDRIGQQLWSIHHPAPGPGAWKRASSRLFQLSGNLLRITSMAVSMTSGLIPSVPIGGVSIISGKSVVKAATRRAGNQLTETGERMADEEDYAALEDSYQYFLTTHKGDERIYLATVDINIGRTVGLTPLPSDSSEIVIDDDRGTLLQAEGTSLTSLPIR